MGSPLALCGRLAFRGRTAVTFQKNFRVRFDDKKFFNSSSKRFAEKTGDGSNEIRTHITIPGPSWLWTTVEPLTYPFRAYGRAQSRKPYTVQIISSFVIYFLGDLSAQYIGRPRDTTEKYSFFRDTYDPHRSLRALAIGGMFSIPSYHWFLYLSHHFNLPSTVRHASGLTLLLKIVINQAVFTPVFVTYFFGTHSLLSTIPLFNSSLAPSSTSSSSSSEAAAAWLTPSQSPGDAFAAAWDRVKATVPTSWYNSCKLWPLVTAFSFTFVPPQSRSVFAGVVAIGWQSYLGILNRRAEMRRKEAAGEA